MSEETEVIGVWIKTTDRLPEPGKYVIGKHNRGTWNDSTDQENVNTVIVKLVQGVSKSDRILMKEGLLPCPIEKSYNLFNGNTTRFRYEIYKPEDEFGNNQRGYNWQYFGIDSFFGQSITHWMHIPKLVE